MFKAINLFTGEIKCPTPKKFISFFIVNNIDEKEAINKIALEFIDQGFLYHFYGKQEKKWHQAFDEADLMVYPNATEESIAMTCGYDDFSEFVDELLSVMHTRYFVPTDVYLFYDDEEIYRSLLEILATKEAKK